MWNRFSIYLIKSLMKMLGVRVIRWIRFFSLVEEKNIKVILDFMKLKIFLFVKSEFKYGFFF